MLSVRQCLAKAAAQSDVDAQSSMETASGDSRSQTQSAASTEAEVPQDTDVVTISPPSASQPLQSDSMTMEELRPALAAELSRCADQGQLSGMLDSIRTHEDQLITSDDIVSADASEPGCL